MPILSLQDWGMDPSTAMMSARQDVDLVVAEHGLHASPCEIPPVLTDKARTKAETEHLPD